MLVVCRSGPLDGAPDLVVICLSAGAQTDGVLTSERCHPVTLSKRCMKNSQVKSDRLAVVCRCLACCCSTLQVVNKKIVFPLDFNVTFLSDLKFRLAADLRTLWSRICNLKRKRGCIKMIHARDVNYFCQMLIRFSPRATEAISELPPNHINHGYIKCCVYVALCKVQG